MDQAELFDEIIYVVRKLYGPTEAQILGKYRDAAFVDARHAAMYLAVMSGKFSISAAARYFKCHHTTIIHARDKLVAYSKPDTVDGRKLSHDLSTMLHCVKNIITGIEAEEAAHGGGHVESRVIPCYTLDLTSQESNWVQNALEASVGWQVEDGRILNVRAIVELAEKGLIACGGSERMKNLIENEAKQSQYIWIFRKVKRVKKR